MALVRPAAGTSQRLASAALERARTHLLGLQEPAGWWKGDLRDQRHDGRRGPAAAASSWASATATETDAGAALDPLASSAPTAPGPPSTAGPADLSTTVEAYVALRLAGDDPDAPHMRAAAAFVRARRRDRSAAGSSPGIWLALFGCGRGTTCPTCRRSSMLPAEVVPAQHLRLRLLGPADHRAADRRRATLRPVRPLPFGLDELRTGAAPRPPRAAAPRLGRRLPAAGPGAARLRAASAAPAAPAGAAPRRRAGSSSGRRPTAAGAASSRRGSTRSSRCTCSATTSTTP